MIEINSQIEDLIFDPITKKYKVVGTRSATSKNYSNSKSSKNYSNRDFVTFKIKPQIRKSTRNLIERKGLHVDFMIK